MKIFDLHKRHGEGTDHVALRYQGKNITYKELDINIVQYAQYFHHLGLGPGDRVALALPNCPEFIYTYLGVAKAGGIAVPINLLQTLEEIIYIIKDSGARFAVISPEIASKMQGLAATLKIIPVILNEETKGQIAASPTAELLPVDDFDVCTFLYTSGTMGYPKGAMLTHANLVGNVNSLDRASDLGTEDNFLCVLPMFHSFGWTACVLLPLYLGSTITILDAFRPKEVLSTLINDGITVFCGVPSMFTVLLRLAEKATFPQLKLAISGGASLPENIIHTFEHKFNFPLLEGYGLSEASPVVCLNPIEGVRKVGSIGIPLPDVEVITVGLDGTKTPVGEVGELIVRGPNVMKGYYNREEDTRQTLSNGWLHTGDLAYKDEDGYFFIVGRQKELIIKGGFNVYPREVEEAITSHPVVLEAAVIGVQHPLKGEEIKAFIVTEDGKTLDKKELLSYLRPKLALYKLPDIVVFTEDLPKSGGGKILKRLLS